MIQFHSLPFPTAEIPDNHPFVVQAYRPRKHYEPCWCGSGKKYKKCHKFREEESPYTEDRVHDISMRAFWKRRGCMHLNVAHNSCSGKVIDAHTIQRKGPLKRIIDSRNHVRQFIGEPGKEGVTIKAIGWKKASTFPGFCEKHDLETFASLEREGFNGSHRHCVLQSYRNLCNEHYRKIASIDALNAQRHIVDRGLDLEGQIAWQMSALTMIEGARKAVEEGIKDLQIYQDVIENNRFHRLQSRVFPFVGDLSLVSCSQVEVLYDFMGRKLGESWRLVNENGNAHWVRPPNLQTIAHSTMSTDKGGAIAFCWKAGSDKAIKLVKSFDEISDADKPEVFVQYCFLHSEMTYFSENWWESLPITSQTYVKRLASQIHYNGGAFTSIGSKLVNWTIQS